MSSISQYLTEEHHHCDDLFAQSEEAANREDWSRAKADFGLFRRATETHFEMEEQVLFPAFEQATGMTLGPTQVMRMEHRQMREMFEQMAQAAEQQDADQFLGLSETLLMLMQQHNLKEEQILYPMADQTLAGQSDALIGSMQALAPAA